MNSVQKRLEAKAKMEYEKVINRIPHQVRAYDTQILILELWKDQGIYRSGRIDTSLVLPFYLKLKLGPVDRLNVEVPFFTEKIEDLFKLKLDSVSLTEDSVKYDYNIRNSGSWDLIIFFTPHKSSKCRIISVEEEVIIKKNIPKVVCD